MEEEGTHAAPLLQDRLGKRMRVKGLRSTLLLHAGIGEGVEE